jgi:anion-transporting  ArsA/GET3 family ATPase
MAMEKLFELHSEGGFDLVVVDTPPTRHALDFVDAPRRLYSFLENRVFRLVLTPTRAYLRAMTLAARALLRAISKVAGAEVVDDAVAFFQAFEGMEQGFRDRARRVEALLADQGTAFTLVVTPREDSIEEARFFAKRLSDSSIAVSALVVNRLLPAFGPDGSDSTNGLDEAVLDVTGPLEAGASAYDELESNLAEFRMLAAGEVQSVAALAEEVPSALVVRVPLLQDDVHDLEGLAAVVLHLLGDK